MPCSSRSALQCKLAKHAWRPGPRGAMHVWCGGSRLVLKSRSQNLRIEKVDAYSSEQLIERETLRQIRSVFPTPTVLPRSPRALVVDGKSHHQKRNPISSAEALRRCLPRCRSTNARHGSAPWLSARANSRARCQSDRNTSGTDATLRV